MKLILSLLLTMLLAGCAGVPAKTTLHYSPPSVLPVRRSISSAQDHATSAKAALKAGDLKGATDQIDALTHELLNAQTALNQAETETAHQTDLLNQANTDKNLAIDQLAATEAKRAAAVRQRNKLFLILTGLGSGLLIFVLRKPIGLFVKGLVLA